MGSDDHLRVGVDSYKLYILKISLKQVVLGNGTKKKSNNITFRIYVSFVCSVYYNIILYKYHKNILSYRKKSFW